MKKFFLSILTCLIFSSSVAQPGSAWLSSISSFLNDNKKYIGCGIGLLSVSGLLYAAYKKYLITPKSRVLETVNSTTDKNMSFQDWYQSCQQLPMYQALDSKAGPIDRPLLPLQVLESTLSNFIKQETKHLNNAQWLGTKFSDKIETFQPFVQKLELRNSDIVAVHGDLHGDVHSLLASIQDLASKGYMDEKDPFKIKKDNFKLIFLGDYVDRGWYGPEVIYTILRLKLANPDKVILVRGNHEDPTINTMYGFSEQLELISKSSCLLDKMSKIYALMPVALYLGAKDQSGNKDFIQCCHGGMEIGYNPQKLLRSNADYELLETLHIKSNIAGLGLDEKEYSAISNDVPKLYIDAKTPQEYVDFTLPFGYMWNDFEVDPTKILSYDRSLKLGKNLTHKILGQHSSETHKVKGVFRAHQHTGEMMSRITNTDGKGHDDDRGCGKLWIAENASPKETKKLWPGIVCTFSVSPNTPYEPFLNGLGETYGILTINQGFENWQLDMVRVDSKPKQEVTEESEEEG